MILKLLYVIYLKSAKITLSVLLRLVNLFAMSMVESLSVLSLCMFKTVRLLNCSWFILERSHVLASGQLKRIFHQLHLLLDLRESPYIK